MAELMKRFFVIFFLFYSSILLALTTVQINQQIQQLINNEEDFDSIRSFEHEFAIISLGTNCQVAWYSRELGLRDFAYPFDWCISPFDTVYSLINNNFENFFLKEHLIQDTDHSVKDTLYNMRFLHDFPAQHGGSTGDANNTHYWGVLSADYMEAYETIKQKYQRRIERFYRTISSGKKVYFVRIFDTTKQQAIDLSNLIQLKFPDLDYKLVVISQYEDFKEQWNIDHIHSFYVIKETMHDLSLIHI